MTSRRGFAATALCLVLTLCGCSVVRFETGTLYRDSEGRFSPRLIAQIAPGQTTDVWLKQQFGAPVWVDIAPYEVAIYTWRFQREIHRKRHLLWVVRQHSVKQEIDFLHTVMQRGKVVKYWQDGTENVDVGRVTYALGLDRPAPESQEPTARGMRPEVSASSIAKPAEHLDTDDRPASEDQTRPMSDSTGANEVRAEVAPEPAG